MAEFLKVNCNRERLRLGKHTALTKGMETETEAYTYWREHDRCRRNGGLAKPQRTGRKT